MRPWSRGAGCADVTVVVAGGADPAGGALDHERLVSEHDSSPMSADVGRDDLAWLFYTSGTTGRPKGAMLSHGILGFVTASWLADITPMDERDVTLHAAPLSHGAGFHALAAIARGAHQVIPEQKSFDAGGVLGLMAETKVTNTWLVPTQIVMLLDALKGQAPDLPSLRYVVYGGAPFPPADLRQALDAFGPVFVQLFGQGETPMTATVLSVRDHVEALAGDRPERLASAGVARPGTEVRILDEEGRALPQVRSARSVSGVAPSCWAIGSDLRTPPKRCAAGGCTPVTSAEPTSTATCTCLTGPRT